MSIATKMQEASRSILKAGNDYKIRAQHNEYATKFLLAENYIHSPLNAFIL